MTDKDAYIKQLENTIAELKSQIANLTEVIQLMRQDKFGSSSEKRPKVKAEVEGQTAIFNEAEVEASEIAEEPVKSTVRGYFRRNPKTKRIEIIKNLPIREILCESGGDDLICPHCNSGLIRLGKEVVRDELEYIPAKLQILRYIRLSYICPNCKHTDHPYIHKALTPTPVMNHSLASPSSVARIIYDKYANALPLYRQEQIWKNIGIELSRATMANWIIRCSQEYFFPIIEHLRQKLIKKEVIHCDETPIQVLKEEGKKPQSNSYMWLYRTSADDKTPIILFDYQPSRNGDNAATYLKNFKGYVHSDGYSGYNKLRKIIRCGCWAHVRRYFFAAIPKKKAADAPPTQAEIATAFCDQLFLLERKMTTLTAEERYTERLKREKPVLETFWAWLTEVRYLNGSAFGKAVNYALNQRPYLENYLLDGRCSISNNLAENAIRPFITGRKNWLFSDTPKGAAASAAAYSIVETAKANNLNVYTYLEYLLLYMPDTDWHNYPETLDDLMPWSDAVQAECKAK